MEKRNVFIEMFLILITAWWSMVLVVNDKLFHNRPEFFYTFQEIGNEAKWASIFILSLISLILGLVWRKAWMRKISLLSSTFLYGMMAAGFILAKQPLNTGVGVYFAIALLALWGTRDVKDDE
ncbi:hypothetical protein [Priestia endophytica]|uniref:hypothetical protein n=1 Tax=Priestia endophytica TaxID=135735 RepID=UPI00228085A8|nr:hypothetical protein [Priestia endophytica]MCY8233408.1 hypothetical protein [Priestia endophytica]